MAGRAPQRIKQGKLPVEPGPQWVTVKGPTEDQEQMALFHMIYLYEGRFPLLKLAHHVPNEGVRAGVEVVRKGKTFHYSPDGLKRARMGVRAGVPDTVLPVRRVYKDREYSGLCIEQKVGSNKPTSEQEWWHEELRKQGWCVVVRYSWIESWRTICAFLGIALDENDAPKVEQP